MADSDRPDYIEFNGDAAFPAPYYLRSTLRSFPVQADADQLQAMCDKFLNLPGADYRYTAPIPLVYVQLVTYPFIVSNVPHFRRMGYFRQDELCFTAPVLYQAGRKRELQFWTPYLFVDSPYSLITGRSMLGFPKLLAEFDIPDDPVDSIGASVRTPLFERYAPDQVQQVGTLLGVQEASPPAPDPPAVADKKELWPFGPPEKLFGEDGMAPLPEDLRARVDEVIAEQKIKLVTLSQLRSPADGSKAAYQAVITCTMSDVELEDAGLSKPCRVELRRCQSMLIGETLGLEGEQSPLATSCPVPIPFWYDYAYNLGEGEVLLESSSRVARRTFPGSGLPGRLPRSGKPALEPPMPRCHAFELNDNPQIPRFVRDTITELLGASLRQAGVYEPAAPLFAEFCRQTGTTAVLDLGSGSGEPVSILIDALERIDVEPPRFTLSDLFPNLPTLDAVACRHPERVEVCPQPLDARRVPERFRGHTLTIISTFHHFPPLIAREILAGAVANRQPVFILEPFPRELARMLPIMAHGVLPALVNPFVARRDRLLKALLTFGAPAALAGCGLWDGVVSTLRMYSRAELSDLVAPLDGFAWRYVRLPGPAGVEATAFLGYPRRTAEEHRDAVSEL